MKKQISDQELVSQLTHLMGPMVPQGETWDPLNIDRHAMYARLVAGREVTSVEVKHYAKLHKVDLSVSPQMGTRKVICIIALEQLKRNQKAKLEQQLMAA